ncbi:NADPH-dependent FMN reductase [Microvirga massiliensis]|uniref:NADPH-dependent FMN reductase n=1 Tax=Microvirga massiliensis TaxID=1033741 RepID=UPI00062BDE19|nr:NAD(P)H-dependent oxidoreductase [Microvirga massiliensis]
MRSKLHVVICSTRPGRVGPTVAHWFHEVAIEHDQFDVALVDLAEFNLPLFDEPKHPRLQQYQHEHTKRWAASVNAADAFVFVTPEYNHGPPPSLLNVLNYVYLEWNYKPAGFVSYGGMSGGMRAVQVEKLTLTTLKVVPIIESVVVSMVSQYIEGGAFKPNDIQSDAAIAMLNELARWAECLKPMRNHSAK